MLKRFIGKVGQELEDWKKAVKVIGDEVEDGKGLHQLETDRRNRSRTVKDTSLQAGTFGRGKEFEN